MKKAFPILGILTAIFLSYALYLAMVVAPREQTMGDVQRIFYYHVPSAWTAFLLFFINFLASVQYLVRRNPSTDKVANWILITVAVVTCIATVVIAVVPSLKEAMPKDVEPSAIGTTGVIIAVAYFVIRRFFSVEAVDALAVTTAEVGVVFCTVVLVAGPLWGIWWTWDVRLTSTLVLWLIYVSYLILRRYSSSGQTPVMAASLAVFGALDVPLVYFSIWIFRTQHPQPVVGGGGSIDPRMLHVLLMNWLAFLCFAYLVCWSRYRLEIMKREVEEAQALQSL
jgi:heme exporter protein C